MHIIVSSLQEGGDENRPGTPLADEADAAPHSATLPTGQGHWHPSSYAIDFTFSITTVFEHLSHDQLRERFKAKLQSFQKRKADSDAGSDDGDDGDGLSKRKRAKQEKEEKAARKASAEGTKQDKEHKHHKHGDTPKAGKHAHDSNDSSEESTNKRGKGENGELVYSRFDFSEAHSDRSQASSQKLSKKQLLQKVLGL